jgi:hypothetical protein
MLDFYIRRGPAGDPPGDPLRDHWLKLGTSNKGCLLTVVSDNVALWSPVRRISTSYDPFGDLQDRANTCEGSRTWEYAEAAPLCADQDARVFHGTAESLGGCIEIA